MTDLSPIGDLSDLTHAIGIERLRVDTIVGAYAEER